MSEEQAETPAVGLAMESEKRAGLAKARSKFRAAVTNPPRTAKAAYGEYAPMDAMEKHVMGELAKANLDFASREDEVGGRPVVISTLTHTETGQYERAVSAIGQSVANQQKVAADVTYIRRRHMQELLCLTADTDQDGNHPGVAATAAKPVKVRPAESSFKKAEQALIKVTSPEGVDAWLGRVSDAVEEGRLTDKEYHELFELSRQRLNALGVN